MGIKFLIGKGKMLNESVAKYYMLSSDEVGVICRKYGYIDFDEFQQFLADIKDGTSIEKLSSEHPDWWNDLKIDFEKKATENYRLQMQ